jgi:hypothetical protein
MARESSKHQSTSKENSLLIKIIYFKISEKTVEEIFLKVREYTEANAIAEVFLQNFIYDYDYEDNVNLKGKETSIWKEMRASQEDTVRMWRIPALPRRSHLAFGFGDIIFFGSEKIVFEEGFVLRKGINSDCPLSIEEISQIIQIYDTDFVNYVDLGNPTIVR